MSYEQPSEANSDSAIRDYALKSPEQQRDSWLDRDYVCAFPGLVLRMLSPEGLLEYLPETREVFFEAALQAFTSYHLSPRAHGASIAKSAVAGQTPPVGIACQPFDYRIDIDKPLLRGDTHEDQACPLLQLNLAGVIALGMSLPDQRLAMARMAEAIAHTPLVGSLHNHISRLLPTNSDARSWIKKHNLDAISGFDWDEALAELVLSYPARIFRPAVNQPNRLPTDLQMEGLREYYSPATMRVFLAYAAEFAERIKLTPRSTTQLVDFLLWVRQMPPEFLSDSSVRFDAFTIQVATSPDAIMQLTSGERVTVREYYQRYGKNQAYERPERCYNREARHADTEAR